MNASVIQEYNLNNSPVKAARVKLMLSNMSSEWNTDGSPPLRRRPRGRAGKVWGTPRRERRGSTRTRCRGTCQCRRAAACRSCAAPWSSWHRPDGVEGMSCRGYPLNMGTRRSRRLQLLWFLGLSKIPQYKTWCGNYSSPLVVNDVLVSQAQNVVHVKLL